MRNIENKQLYFPLLLCSAFSQHSDFNHFTPTMERGSSYEEKYLTEDEISAKLLADTLSDVPDDAVSNAAHSQHWLCSRMHMQNRLASPFPEHTIAMQKFCQHQPYMHATVWKRLNFHAVFWVEYYTSDWTLIARSWPEQICMSTGCCCSNFTF